MQMLHVYDFEGRQDASTPEELRHALHRRFDGANQFKIAAADAAFPMLDVMVNDRLAVLHYFASEGVAGDQSESNLDDVPDIVEFPENRTGAVLPMPGSTVVDVDTAMRSAEQFAEGLQRPTLIDWLEL